MTVERHASPLTPQRTHVPVAVYRPRLTALLPSGPALRCQFRAEGTGFCLLYPSHADGATGRRRRRLPGRGRQCPRTQRAPAGYWPFASPARTRLSALSSWPAAAVRPCRIARASACSGLVSPGAWARSRIRVLAAVTAWRAVSSSPRMASRPGGVMTSLARAVSRRSRGGLPCGQRRAVKVVSERLGP
jgi:hypothetical protein